MFSLGFVKIYLGDKLEYFLKGYLNIDSFEKCDQPVKDFEVQRVDLLKPDQVVHQWIIEQAQNYKKR
jgi:hypothetical protein